MTTAIRLYDLVYNWLEEKGYKVLDVGLNRDEYEWHFIKITKAHNTEFSDIAFIWVYSDRVIAGREMLEAHDPKLFDKIEASISGDLKQ